MIYHYWLVQGVFLSGEGTAEKKNKKLLTSDHLPTFSSPQWTHKFRPKCGWLVIPSNWLTLYSMRLWKQKESWEKKAPKTVGKPECVLFCILPSSDFELSSKFWFDFFFFFTPQYPVFPQWIPSQWWWWWFFSHMLKKRLCRILEKIQKVTKFWNYFLQSTERHLAVVVVMIGSYQWPCTHSHSLTSCEKLGAAPRCLCSDCSGPAEENENWARSDLSV